MRLKDKKVIALLDDDFEELELWYPILRLQEDGATVHLVGKVGQKKYIGKYGVPAESDFAFSDINIKEYDAIIVPGGWAPDQLRRNSEVIDFIKDRDKSQKTIGQICHAGWVPIYANI